MALKHIKSKIKSTERTSKVTKAMEAVSAVKMRKSQERALKGRPYAEAALRILGRVSQSLSAKNHPLILANSGTHDCIIVITSDKGLAGNLNAAVLKEAATYASTFKKEELELICFGKKSFEFFSRRGYRVSSHYLNVSDDIMLNDVREVIDCIVTRFSLGKYRTVAVVFQSFVSTFEQRAVIRRLLPLNVDELSRMIEDIVPKRGRYSDIKEESYAMTYTVEPSEEEVLNTLFPNLVQIMLYHALLESKASEHSARMVAMKNATDKAREVTKALTLLYNKERQSVITAEVSEITGGIEAMKQH